MKKLLALVLVVLMILSLTGCISANDSSRHLHVVAHHSLLGVWDDRWEETVILEEDDFGRVMFAFAGSTAMSDRSGSSFNILAVLIMQRTTGRHAYFYDGVNVILHEIGGLPPPIASRFVTRYFSEEQLEQLKEENDWNRALDEDRFFRVRVSYRCKTHYMTDVSRQTKRESLEAVSEGFHSGNSVPLTADRNGNVLYVMRGRSFDWEERKYSVTQSFLFMFNSDGNLIEETGVMELTDLWNYREQLREFKEANGWNFYYR